MIFKKHEYSIICDTESCARVRKFAERHCAKGTGINIYGHGSLLNGNAVHRVEFKTWEPKKILDMAIKDTFRDRTVKYGRVLVFVRKEEES